MTIEITVREAVGFFATNLANRLIHEIDEKDGIQWIVRNQWKTQLRLAGIDYAALSRAEQGATSAMLDEVPAYAEELIKRHEQAKTRWDYLKSALGIVTQAEECILDFRTKVNEAFDTNNPISYPLH